MHGRLRHGGGQIEGLLMGKRVVGMAAGGQHTVVWSDEGKAYSFGFGGWGQLGHGDEENEHVPRLIEGVLVGKSVVDPFNG